MLSRNICLRQQLKIPEKTTSQFVSGAHQSSLPQLILQNVLNSPQDAPAQTFRISLVSFLTAVNASCRSHGRKTSGNTNTNSFAGRGKPEIFYIVLNSLLFNPAHTRPKPIYSLICANRPCVGFRSHEAFY